MDSRFCNVSTANEAPGDLSPRTAFSSPQQDHLCSQEGGKGGCPCSQEGYGGCPCSQEGWRDVGQHSVTSSIPCRLRRRQSFSLHTAEPLSLPPCGPAAGGWPRDPGWHSCHQPFCPARPTLEAAVTQGQHLLSLSSFAHQVHSLFLLLSCSPSEPPPMPRSPQPGCPCPCRAGTRQNMQDSSWGWDPGGDEPAQGMEGPGKHRAPGWLLRAQL